MRTSWWLSVAVAVAALGVTPPASAQQPRVAVAPFGGVGADSARRQVHAALEQDGRVSVVDLDRVDRAARSSGAGSDGDDGIAELARTLDSAIVVQGRVAGRGRRRRLQLTARDEHGAVLARAGAAMRGGGISRAVRSLLDQALGGLQAAPEEPVREDAAEEEPEEVPTATASAPASAALDVRAPLLAIQAALVIGSRDHDVVLRDAGTAMHDTWYAMLGARAELRPLAADPGLVRGIYGHVSFAHSVGLSARYEDEATGEILQVPTNFWRLAFGVGILLPLADVVHLGAEIGAGWDAFSLAPNPILESAEYVYVRPAVRARVSLLREIVGLDAEVGVRPVLSRGGLSAYGDAGDTFGFDVGGGLSGAIALSGSVGLSWAAQLGWVGYWMQFANADGSSSRGSHGSDTGVRIHLLLGLAIW